jgi:hypothetical protein
MARAAISITPSILADWIANFTTHVDESTVLRESTRITSLSTDRRTEVVRMLTDSITVRQAAPKLVRAEIIRRQGPPDPKQLVCEFE